MNYIPMQVLEYRFDEQGITEQITVAFQVYQGGEQFNSRVVLTQEYVHTINENVNLDSMTKEQIENYSRRKLREWIAVERPEEDPEVTE